MPGDTFSRSLRLCFKKKMLGKTLYYYLSCPVEGSVNKDPGVDDDKLVMHEPGVSPLPHLDPAPLHPGHLQWCSGDRGK